MRASRSTRSCPRPVSAPAPADAEQPLHRAAAQQHVAAGEPAVHLAVAQRSAPGEPRPLALPGGEHALRDRGATSPRRRGPGRPAPPRPGVGHAAEKVDPVQQRPAEPALVALAVDLTARALAAHLAARARVAGRDEHRARGERERRAGRARSPPARPPAAGAAPRGPRASTRPARPGTARPGAPGSSPRAWAGCLRRPAPAAEIVWWGARNGRAVARPPEPSPATLWIRVISSASSNDGGGRMPGSRRATIVLPAPGGPAISRLWPPAAAISSARFASACPRTSRHVGQLAAVRELEPRAAWPARAPSGRGAGPRAAPGWRTPSTSTPLASAASPALASGTIIRRYPRACAPERRREHPPDGPQLAAERQLPADRRALERLPRDLTARGEHPDGDREVERGPRLAHRRGREVRREPLLRELELGVQQRGAHALARLPHRGVGQPDEREGGQAAADVDLDGDLPSRRLPRRRTWRPWRAWAGR